MSLDQKSIVCRSIKRGACLAVLVLIVLSGCSAIQPANTSGTLNAQNSGFVAEATHLAATAAARTTEVWLTAIWSGTYVYTHDQINLKLLATVRANEPPTQQVIAINPTGPVGVSGPVTIGAPEAPVGGATVPAGPPVDATGMQFTDNVTTSAVRESDGCAVGSQNSFPTSTARIYVVTRALNIRAGTQMGVEWRQGGQAVDSKSYAIPQDQASLCVWFYIDSFTPGDWSVQLSANSQPIGSPLAFTVEAG